MYQDFGAAYALGLLLGLLLLAFALIVAVVLAVISWRWSRQDRSFVALAFPVALPLWGIVCAAFFVDVSAWTHYRPVKPVWVGICTLAAVLIMARALWLRPGADLGSAPARRSRQWEIAVTAVGAGLLYVLWVANVLLLEHRAAQNRARYEQQQTADRAAADARIAEWSHGRIVGRPQAMCYSPDARYLVTADEWVQVWDLATGQTQRRWEDRLRGPGAPRRLYGFDQGGTRFVLGSGAELDVFDLGGGRERLPRLGDASEIQFLSKHSAVVVLARGKATAFDVQTGQPVNPPIAALQEPGIAALAVSGDEGLLATWSRASRRIAMWTTSSAQPSWTADHVEVSEPVNFAFSPDNRWLALAARDNQIVVRSAASGAELLRLEAGRTIRHFTFSPDGAQVVALTAESRFSTRGTQVQIWSLPAGRTVVTHSLPVSSGIVMALSPGGQEVAVVDEQRSSSPYLPATVRRFATATGVERLGFASPSP